MAEEIDIEKELETVSKHIKTVCGKCDKYDPDATFSPLEYIIYGLQNRCKALEAELQQTKAIPTEEEKAEMSADKLSERLFEVQTIGDGVTICVNCGHLLWYDTGSDPPMWKHYTRAYKAHGYPYCSQNCYGPHCHCERPEPSSKLSNKRGD